MGTEQRRITDCIQCICSNICAIKTALSALTTTVNTISTKVDSISTELDLSELTDLTTDTNSRVQSMGLNVTIAMEASAEAATQSGITNRSIEDLTETINSIDAALDCNCEECVCESSTEIITE